MTPQETINRTIETFRATKSAEFRVAANEQPQRLLNLREVAGIVDEALEEVRHALMEDLEDEASESERWWGGSDPGPHSYFKESLTDEGYLPRDLPE